MISIRPRLLSSVIFIQFIFVYLRFSLLLSSDLRLDLPGSLFPLDFRIKFSYVFRWAGGWIIGVLGFDSRRGLGILLFATASRTALGPTQPPIQWALGALSLGVKRPGCEADHSPPSSAEVIEWVELYLHSPNTPSWRGAQLKQRDNFTFYILFLTSSMRATCSYFLTMILYVYEMLSSMSRTILKQLTNYPQ
jgi:hypothetical protein